MVAHRCQLKEIKNKKLKEKSLKIIKKKKKKKQNKNITNLFLKKNSKQQPQQMVNKKILKCILAHCCQNDNLDPVFNKGCFDPLQI